MALEDDLFGTKYPNFSEHGTPPCAESDPDAFVPEKGTPTNSQTSIKFAIRVCQECPYKQRCLEYATEQRLPGIWGGTSEVERRRLRMANRDKYPKRW